MLISVIRRKQTDNSTIGEMFVDDKYYCYTLENPQRKKKIWGRTAIPAGVYSVQLRTSGRFHKRYSKRFPDMHKGMIHITGVPDFKYILIHIGNDEHDTAGCILVGMSYGRDWLNDSERAYRKLYPVVAKALESGEPVTITITDDRIEKIS